MPAKGSGSGRGGRSIEQQQRERAHASFSASCFHRGAATWGRNSQSVIQLILVAEQGCVG